MWAANGKLLGKKLKEGAMNQLTAHKEEYTRNKADLYLAFELGNREWKLGFTVGFGQKPRERTVLAGDLAGVKGEIDRAKKRFGLSRDACFLSCYEAGRDGFWLYRYLVGPMCLDFNTGSRTRGLVYPDLGPRTQSRPLPRRQLLSISGFSTSTNGSLSPNRHMLWYPFP